MTSAPQDASPKSLIEKLEELKRNGTNFNPLMELDRGYNAALVDAIAIVERHGAAQGDLIAILLHFANRYCPLNDDGKPEALRLIAAMNMGDASARKDEDAGQPALMTSPASDSLGSPVRYTDGSISREYEEQPDAPVISISEDELQRELAAAMAASESDHPMDWAGRCMPVLRHYLRTTEPVRFYEAEHKTRYQIGEKAIADCFPRSADPSGIYHLDAGNLQALVHTAIELRDEQCALKPVMVDLETGAKAHYYHGQEAPYLQWDGLSDEEKGDHRELVKACAKAWGLKWK